MSAKVRQYTGPKPAQFAGTARFCIVLAQFERILEIAAYILDTLQ